MNAFDVLFFDIGGVCLTNGWDRDARAAAAEHFALDAEDMASRHEDAIHAFECGDMSLDAYLDIVVFHEPRDFGRHAFTDFMRSRSRPHEEVLALVSELAASGRYRLATINNESRELNAYRIERFGLDRWFEAFFSSCYLGVRKPGARIFRTAAEVLGVEPARCLFVDDRRQNVEGAAAVGFSTVHAPVPAGVRGQLCAAGVHLPSASVSTRQGRG